MCKPWKSKQTIGVILALFFACIQFPTYADSSLIGVNTYTTNLPAYVDGPTKFTVTITGTFSDKVCSMTYGDQQLTSAPWTFTFQPDPDATTLSVGGSNPSGRANMLSLVLKSQKRTSRIQSLVSDRTLMLLNQ